ncbi:MAG: hypothetical protein H6696_15220 [Deferribacteres bacterium]|nr:hypothetical protein [candidate division KSB1 bacterium]MCB9503278.1 hypothetical protein [Deferribacteres bacterium]
MRKSLFYALGFMLLSASISLAQQVKSKYDVTFYGFVKAEAIYETSETAVGDWFLFARPDGSPQSDQEIFTMNARHTRLGMKFANPVGEDGAKVTGLVEFDFAGGFPNSSTAARQPLVRLRHAWVQISKGNWESRFGQDWALISGPFPNTASFVVGAGKGNLWMRFPQIKVTYAGKPMKVALSINRPMAGNIKYDNFAGGSFDPVGDGERSGMPWFMGRAWFNAGSAKLSASFHYGSEQINDLSGNPHDKPSFSINADAEFSSGPLAFTIRGFKGENLNSFFGGVFQGFSSDATSVNNVASMGGWAQAKYTINPKWSATIGGGLDDPEDDYVSRTRNDWFFGNIAYNAYEAVTFMLETQYLKTSYKTSDAGTSNRFQFVTYYKF